MVRAHPRSPMLSLKTARFEAFFILKLYFCGMQYFVYILESTCGSHYIGFTSNLEQRLAQHNRKHHGSTYRKNETWHVLIAKEFDNKEIAQKEEKYLKSLKNFKKAIEYLRGHHY